MMLASYLSDFEHFKIGEVSARWQKGKKYYIALDGKIFEVSRELYEAYYKGRRKERYFTQDLKQEHTRDCKIKVNIEIKKMICYDLHR